MDAGRKRELEAKVYEGVRLTVADGEELSTADDLAWLGRLAHHVRTVRHGDRVTFDVAGPGDTGRDEAPREPGPDWVEWSRLHRAAHAEGRRTRVAARLGDLPRLRDLQDETGGLVAVTARHDGQAPAEVLRTVAVCRLLLDNVPHVTAAWDAAGRSVAQLSLHFGVDDLDGAAAGAERDDLLELIWDAGFRPVERDAGYAVVREYDGPVPLARRRSEPQQVWA